MLTSYWSSVLDTRLSRRRALVGTGAGVASAAFLAACGGSGSGGNSSSGTSGTKTSDKSSLVSKTIDTSKSVKRGGIIKDRLAADPPTLDLIGPVQPWNSVGPMVYNSLVAFTPGYQKLPENEIGPDLAESWETSPDGLQITFKLRQNVKWHNKAPLNGRVFDSADIVATWERFTKKHASRASIANVVDPSAPVLGITATDSKTVVMKLKEPLVYVLGLFAPNWSSGINIVPKETDGTFDPRQDMIGTGPFYLDKYTPSVGVTLKRNADYWDKDYAYVDQVDIPIVSEYAAALAQLKAGNLHSLGAYASGVAQEDILPVKKEAPNLAVYAAPGVVAVTSGNIGFGWLGKSPFFDERVRQAVSMAIDRDLFMDTFGNVSSFNSQGLPVETRWNTVLTASSEGWWLDPKDEKAFGPNAKYFKHDPAESKKLLAAAGFSSGFEVTSNYVTGTQLGVQFPKSAEVVDGMMKDIGITTKVKPIDYATEYTPKFRDGKGQYDGWAYRTNVGAGYDYTSIIAGQVWSKGGAAFYGFSANNTNDQAGDPQIDALVEKARLEKDTEKRKQLGFDIQRAMGKSMYMIPAPGASTNFVMAWPALMNYKVFPGGPARGWLNYKLWLDETKPPFKTS